MCALGVVTVSSQVKPNEVGYLCSGLYDNTTLLLCDRDFRKR